MDKKLYTSLEIEVVEFEAEDIMCVSGPVTETPLVPGSSNSKKAVEVFDAPVQAVPETIPNLADIVENTSVADDVSSMGSEE